MNKDFYTPGDLDGGMLKPAGSLEQGNTYFKMAGDLKDNNSKNEVEEYLKSVVTGKRTPPEFGHFPIAAGQRFVSFEELKNMVDRGDNIVRAEYFEQMGKILIEFETFELENNEVRHR